MTQPTHGELQQFCKAIGARSVVMLYAGDDAIGSVAYGVEPVQAMVAGKILTLIEEHLPNAFPLGDWIESCGKDEAWFANDFLERERLRQCGGGS